MIRPNRSLLLWKPTSEDEVVNISRERGLPNQDLETVWQTSQYLSIIFEHVLRLSNVNMEILRSDKQHLKQSVEILTEFSLNIIFRFKNQ